MYGTVGGSRQGRGSGSGGSAGTGGAQGSVAAGPGHWTGSGHWSRITVGGSGGNVNGNEVGVPLFIKPLSI